MMSQLNPSDVSIIMSTKLVLIVNAGSLLMEGITGLLTANLDDGFKVVSTEVRSLVLLMEEIERVNPTVILMEDDIPFLTPGDLLAGLQPIRKIRVIVLSMQINKVDVYDKSRATVYHKSEFPAADLDLFFKALNFKSAPFL